MFSGVLNNVATSQSRDGNYGLIDSSRSSILDSIISIIDRHLLPWIIARFSTI